MMKLAELIEKNAEELAALETLDNGKAYSVSGHFCGHDISVAFFQLTHRC